MGIRPEHFEAFTLWFSENINEVGSEYRQHMQERLVSTAEQHHGRFSPLQNHDDEPTDEIKDDADDERPEA